QERYLAQPRQIQKEAASVAHGRTRRSSKSFYFRRLVFRVRRFSRLNYRPYDRYQSGLGTGFEWAAGWGPRRWWLMRVAEGAVDEHAQADDDEEPADADAFALDANEPEQHHQAEAD